MGRGSSGASAGGTSVKSVRGQNGETIDLSGFPLKYGGLDKTMSPSVREKVEEFEKKRLKSKIEFGTLVDENGNSLIEKRGGSGSVRLPTYLYNQANTMSHNHPRGKGEEGLLGGTFSTADIDAFAGTNVSTLRASAFEGAYSISKGKNFDGLGLLNYSKKTEKDLRSVYREKNQKERIDFNAGKTSYNEYRKNATKNFNEYLVNRHNAFLEGQKKYGYTYTLEKRG